MRSVVARKNNKRIIQYSQFPEFIHYLADVGVEAGHHAGKLSAWNGCAGVISVVGKCFRFAEFSFIHLENAVVGLFERCMRNGIGKIAEEWFVPVVANKLKSLLLYGIGGIRFAIQGNFCCVIVQPKRIIRVCLSLTNITEEFIKSHFVGFGY